MEKKDQRFIKRENQNLMLDIIQNNEAVTRAKLAKLTEMSPTTVSRIVESLIDMGLVKETNRQTEGVGRKATILALNPDLFITIGIELDERCIRYGFFDFLGRSIVTEETEKGPTQEPESVIMQMKQDIFRMIDQHHISNSKVAKACVGLPGIVDNVTGEVIMSAQLGWEHVPLAERLEQHLGIRVSADNELKLRAFAENFFTDNQHHTMVVIGIGNGVGSAVINEGKIYRGSLNSAGEIGHTVVDPNGMLCTCGNFGCLQTYIAEDFLVQEASKKSDAQNLTDIINASKGGNKWATNILERAITYAGITVNNSVCLYNPDKVILMGSMLEKSTYIRDRILEASRAQIWPPLEGSLSIEMSELGGKGVIIGAGMAAKREYVDQLSDEREFV